MSKQGKCILAEAFKRSVCQGECASAKQSLHSLRTGAVRQFFYYIRGVRNEDKDDCD